MPHKNKFKTKLFGLFIGIFFVVNATIFSPVFASGCGNLVPNPANPNCDPNIAKTSVGSIWDSAVGVIPFIITIVVVISVGRGALKVSVANDAEGRQAGFKIIINAGLGAVLFYSIWLILFLISYLTNGNLLGIFG